MQWTIHKSILLSRAMLILFAIVLLLLDIGCYWWTGMLAAWEYIPVSWRTPLIISFLTASVFAWAALIGLWCLIGNIDRSEVFVDENVRHLRLVSWCCWGVAAVCLASCGYTLEFVPFAAGAAFMALIVRIVKNVFEQAIAMKSELDLTI